MNFFSIHPCFQSDPYFRFNCISASEYIFINLSGAGGCSHTERHPRTIKDSYSSIQVPTAKRAKISSI